MRRRVVRRLRLVQVLGGVQLVQACPSNCVQLSQPTATIQYAPAAASKHPV